MSVMILITTIVGQMVAGQGLAPTRSPLEWTQNEPEEAWAAVHRQGGLPWYDAHSGAWRPVALPAEGRSPDQLLRHRSSTWQPAPQPIRSGILARVFDWISSTFFWISRVFRAQWVGWLAVALMVFAILTLLVWVWRGGSFAGEPERQESVVSVSPDQRWEGLPLPVTAGTVELWQVAQQMRANGRVREALAYLYCHVLLAFQEAGLISFSPGKTARDYATELSDWPDLYEDFQLIATWFQRAFFGYERPQSEVVDACFHAAENLVHTTVQPQLLSANLLSQARHSQETSLTQNTE